MNNLYTIGYTNHSLESFIEVIKKYGINAIADVRSIPFSKYNYTFNKNILSNFLNHNDIKYVFLGNECGARFDDPACYHVGKADYKLIAKHKTFQHGLMRIKKGSKSYTIALMCAEKDPINCHRMILICRNLKDSGLPIYHIINAEKVETQSESEKRLLMLFRLNQLDLFHSEDDQLEKAYDKQGDRIAYFEDTRRKENGDGYFTNIEYPIIYDRIY